MGDLGPVALWVLVAQDSCQDELGKPQTEPEAGTDRLEMVEKHDLRILQQLPSWHHREVYHKWSSDLAPAERKWVGR